MNKKSTNKKKIIIWPIYFDSRFSRKKGRRVPISYAIENPSLEILYKATKSRGLTTILDTNSKHPKTWFDSKGRIIVYTDLKKSEVIKRIGRELRNICRKERKK